MVETISPVGYGDRRGRWLIAVALYTSGAAVAAAAFGGALGVAGALLGAPWGAAGLALTGVVAVLYAAREAFGLPIPVPAARRQVPDWWRTFFSWPVAATLYGAGLGVGFFTFLTHGGLVVVGVAAVASGRPLAGAVIVGAFGLARGLSALVAWPVRTRDAGTEQVDRLSNVRPMQWRLLNAAALASVAVALGWRLGSAPPGLPASDVFAVAAAVLAAAFAWAAGAKLALRGRWHRTLAAFGLPPQVARTALVAVPAAELAVPALVVVGLPAAASATTLALLAVFSFAIVSSRIRGGRTAVACGCFGGAASRDYRLLLARNGALAVLAGVTAASPTRLRWPEAPAGGGSLPFVLASVGVVVAGWTAWRAAAWLARGSTA
jgi:hypothetical protein